MRRIGLRVDSLTGQIYCKQEWEKKPGVKAPVEDEEEEDIPEEEEEDEEMTPLPEVRCCELLNKYSLVYIDNLWRERNIEKIRLDMTIINRARECVTNVLVGVE